MDALRLKNLQFYGHHGQTEAEATIGHRYEIDVELKASLRLAALSDDLADTFDFDRVYQIVSDIVTGSTFKLIERLCDEICRSLLQEFPPAVVIVTVRKPQPPVNGILDSVEVEMTRGPAQDQVVKNVP